MDALRLERLVWAALFGLVVAAPLGFFLAPDPTGFVPFALAALAFVVAVPLVFRAFAFAASPTAEAGDVTARFASFFVVSFTLRLGLDAVASADSPVTSSRSRPGGSPRRTRRRD
ncbi:hypothetical protein [Halogeometricum sp. CBA1124]|uniref:hypothetical protein n=1 Tax=Halogeometricum sp. CBA1124 TaxID=2668071 RepID=UPI001E333A9B|nr:hypothetical protein [Halogeometricum sp. CBA1124]